MSGHRHFMPDVQATGFDAKPAAGSALVVGQIESVVGACSLTRPGGDPFQVKPGDPICRGDLLETTAGGKVGIRFIDGTAFNLSDSARAVVKEFGCDGAEPSALFDISRGTFAFIAGEMAKLGRLRIETPFASIRGRAQSGGIGMLSLASLFFAALDNAQGATTPPGPEDGIINIRDSNDIMNAPFGIIELTVGSQTIFIDTPFAEFVVRGTSVSQVPLSLAQLQQHIIESINVQSIAALGQGPTVGGPSGSGGLPPPEPPPFVQPINFVVPPNPGGPTGGSTGGNSAGPGSNIFIPPPLGDALPTPPTVTTDSSTVNVIHNNATITFTFSVAPTDFDLADTSTTGGTLLPNSFVMVDATHYTATFVAVDGIQINNASVSVIGGSYHDINGNLGLGANTTFSVDTLSPSVVSVTASDITDADVGSVTFQVTVTFNDAMTTDGSADPTLTFNPAVAGTLTLAGPGVWSAGGTTYTATYNVADANVSLANVTIDVTGAVDANGNAQTDYTPQPEFSIDTANASVIVNIVDGALSDGDSSSVVTFTFSEAPGASFTEADIQVSAGLTLNAGSLSMIDATHYQATVTAVDSFTGTGTVSLAAGSWTDAALNLGGAGSDSVPIDRQNPTVVVDLVDGALSDGDSSSVVTFTFSEAPGASFTEADIQVSAGLTLNAGSLSMIDATHYQATVTAVDSFTGTGTVSLAAGSWTDAALNLGGAGSDSVPIDRQNPTVVVDLVDGALSDGDSSSVVTFTFSEAPGASFTEADIQVSAGLTLNAGSLSMIDATHYQATVTAVDSFTGTGTVSLAAGSWTDAALNLGGAGSDSVPIDRQNPTVVVDLVDGALSDGDSSSVVTFTFSEAPGASFTEADIQVSAGLTLNAGSLSMIDATHYQATVTAVDSFTGTGTVSLAAGSWTDAALNLGGAGSDTVSIDLPTRAWSSILSTARSATGTAARL